MKTILKLFLVVVFFMMPFGTYAQGETEGVSEHYFKWGTNPDVKVKANTLSNLTFWNYHALTPENKRDGVWFAENIRMNVNWVETRPWKISFNIGNQNSRHDYKYNVYDSNGKELWHKEDIYWGFEISVNKSSTVDTFKKYYCSRKKVSPVGTYTSTWDSERNSWSSVHDSYTRHVTIEYDGKGKIVVCADNNVAHTFYGAKSLSSITLCAGPAAEVFVSGFYAQRLTLYGEVKPIIASGDAKLAKEDYWGAISEYTKVINKGYKNYDVYLNRAKAYYAMEFHNNVIDDITNALVYRKTEEAYLYRGLTKLMLEDVTCIDDLKRGGQKGLAIVREIESEIGQIPKSTAPTSKYKASGTGFFVDSRGYIVTNYHVIEGSRGIDVFVTRSGNTVTYSAKIVASDRTNDLSMIKISDSDFYNLPAIPYLIGAGTCDVGTSVFAMGYPQLSYLGEEIKVTDGIISSKTGYQGDVTTYQISAPIQPGNSGGPLFDANGTVVGITNAGVTEMDNVGYAIKTSYLRNLIDACPETIYLPSLNQVRGLTFTEKIKKISPYVVIIKIY